MDIPTDQRWRPLFFWGEKLVRGETGSLEQSKAVHPFAVTGLLLKAVPHTEGERRLVRCEPASGNRDLEKDRLSIDALERQAAFFLRHGNLDIQHRTIMGPEMGYEHPEDQEIGKPVDVRFNPLVVIGEIYRSTAPTIPPHLEAAESFWKSLTAQDPAKSWYPSVGGLKLQKSCDDEGCDVQEVLWVNIGFWRVPIDLSVPTVKVMPIEAMAKTVLAGYGSDPAQLTGGGATRKESLHGQSHGVDRDYAPIATRFLKAVASGGSCEHTRPPLSAEKVIAHFCDCERLVSSKANRFAIRLVTDWARRSRQAQEQSAAQAA